MLCRNCGNGEKAKVTLQNSFLYAVIKRLLTSFIVIFLLISFIFILIRLSPGDPALKYISATLDTQLADRVIESFNLDKPITNQYFTFVKNLFVGDFGISISFRQPVLEVISDYFIFTFIFSTIALVIQFFVSLLLVRFSFKRKNKLLDKSLNKLSLVVYVIPSFVLGLVLIYLFSVKLNLLPISGLRSINYDDYNYLEKFLDLLSHLILPIITLTAAGIAIFYRYLRDSIEEISKQSFITNIKAMGVEEKVIFYKHILPNAIRPLISVAGVEYGILLGGSLITEVIFSLPGMGQLTVSAIFNRDFPLVMGCSFIAGVMIIFSNLLADLIKIKIDKRLVSELIR